MSEPSDRNLAEFEKWRKAHNVMIEALSSEDVAYAAWLAALATQAERENAAVAAAVQHVVARLEKERNERYTIDSKSYLVMNWAIIWAQRDVTPDQQSALDRHDAET